MRFIISGLFLWIVAFHHPLLSQIKNDVIDKSLGHPYLHNHSPDEYGATAQNWSIIQDHRGVMYFGNTRGILEYDGVSWRTIPAGDGTIIRSLAIDKYGKIYVGAYGDFGYLKPDDKGDIVYQSLAEDITEVVQDFEDVWTIHVGENEIYFHSTYNLFRLKNDSIKIWETKKSYHRSFLINNKLYLRQDGIGLTMLEGDSLKAIPGGDFFSEEYISAMLPLPNEQILIGTRTKGLFLFDPNNHTNLFREFSTKYNDLLKVSNIYHGLMLNDEVFALATLNAGLFVMDLDGNLIQYFAKRNGLIADNILYLYQDQANSLWAATGNGISHIEVFSPSGFLGENSNLKDAVYSTIIYDSTLFAATDAGIFYLDNVTNILPEFKKVEKINNQSWCFLLNESGDSLKLLVGSNDGIWSISKKENRYQADQIVLKQFVFTLFAREGDSNKVFAGLKDGVLQLSYDGNHWTENENIQGIDEKILSITEDDLGNLWLGTNYSGVIKIDNRYFETSRELDKNSYIKKYDVYNGLPSKNWNHVYYFEDELLVATVQGVYTYDSENDRFKIHEEIKKALGDAERWLYKIDIDRDQNIWFDSDLGKGILVKNDDGTFTLSEYQLKIFKPALENEVSVFASDDSVVWFGSIKGLARFKFSDKNANGRPFQTLIRKVTNANDSTFFNGGYFSTDQPAEPKLKLKANRNNISFEFATTSYMLESENEYKYKLDNFDEKWSSWTNNSKKDYTNLPGGDYTFRVISKNVFGYEGVEATYSFIVLTPYYKTWWARSGYVLVCLFFIFGYSKWRNFQLQKKQKDLELLVEKRTVELQVLNDSLEELVAERTLDLEEKNKRLEEYAFTNAHELRSPVVNLLGLAELYEVEDKKEVRIKLVKMAKSEIIRLNKITYEIQSKLAATKTK